MDNTVKAEQIISLMLRLKDCLKKYSQQCDCGKNIMILGSLYEYERRLGRPESVSEIAHASGLALPNVSRLLVPLELEELITREKNGRKVSVIITENGRERLKECWSGLVSLMALAIEGLDPADCGNFIRTGGEIAAYIEGNYRKSSAGGNEC